MDEMFTSTDQCKIKTRSSLNKLMQPHCNRESGYKASPLWGQSFGTNSPLILNCQKTPTLLSISLRNFSLRHLKNRMMTPLSITNLLFLPSR